MADVSVAWKRSWRRPANLLHFAAVPDLRAANTYYRALSMYARRN